MTKRKATSSAAPRPDYLIIPITLDRPRNMRLTIREAIAYREATKNPERPHGVWLFFGDVPTNEEDWIRLLHEALAWEDPSLTFERVFDMIEVRHFTAVLEGLGTLLQDFRPARGAGEVGPSVTG